MHEKLCANFLAYLTGAGLQVLDVTVVARKGMRPKSTYYGISGVGLLEISWRHEPSMFDQKRFEMLVKNFKFDEAVQKTSTVVTADQLVKMMESWDSTTLQPFLLRVVANLLVRDLDLAKACGLHL